MIYYYQVYLYRLDFVEVIIAEHADAIPIFNLRSSQESALLRTVPNLSPS